jgi:hypothetical protein
LRAVRLGVGWMVLHCRPNRSESAKSVN